MTTLHHPELEPRIEAAPIVVRIHVGRALAIDLFANAALRWLCRAGATSGTWIVAIQPAG